MSRRYCIYERNIKGEKFDKLLTKKYDINVLLIVYLN